MKQPKNISEVAELQPDYMGFIFYEKTPRYFEAEIPQLSPGIKKTGVFVNASVDYILEKVKKNKLQTVQLHGGESAEFCQELKIIFAGMDRMEIIKVFSVKEEFDFSELQEFEESVDYFLFDTKGKTKGGTGETFNWELLKDYPSSTPFFLSGGIGPEEVDDIKKLQKHFEQQGKPEVFYAVDVNSKFELEPGMKDPNLLQKFSEKLKK
ncbi:phosphoribosylanthranilate isomerase [Salegentibacter sp.]|uniref:phosphoribosylanthranilate isomerase n=1 Tax=Salegentibacter sp. TaxID=1903072 RepID=UPI003563AC0C